MKTGEIILGVFTGLLVWLAAFVMAFVVAGVIFNGTSAAMSFLTALVLVVIIIATFRKIGKSGLIAGMVITLAAAVLLSTLCGFSNPTMGG
jgi:hypothetical protein